MLKTSLSYRGPRFSFARDQKYLILVEVYKIALKKTYCLNITRGIKFCKRGFATVRSKLDFYFEGLQIHTIRQ